MTCYSLNQVMLLQVFLTIILIRGIGDPFKEPASVPMRTHKKEGHKEAGHEASFKPAKTIQRKVKADFEHMTDHKDVHKNYKGPDGVITGPRNFLTNPPKVGQVGKG